MYPSSGLSLFGMTIYFALRCRAASMVSTVQHELWRISNLRWGNDQPKHLPNGHPCLWLEPQGTVAPLQQVLENLLTAQPRAPVALTGRKKCIPKEDKSGEYDAGYKEAIEVMLLLNEDELAHRCDYCGSAEEFYGDYHDVKYVKIGGKGYSSTYGCPECLEKSFFARALMRMG
ncbi:hypothetical protein C8R47DRAFT_92809 [Mycena vitilis]|nr:hypothetical protein C8R47DRAFT_92809 [Mycena vitilis]